MNDPKKDDGRRLLAGSAEVVFFHGLESGPWGRKSLALRDAGFVVAAPDFRGTALEERVARALEFLDARSSRPTVIVGSSYGGAVAAVVADRLLRDGRPPRGVILCAPALYLPEPPISGSPPCPAPSIEFHVIHGSRDDVVPIEWSRRWCVGHRCAVLEEVDDDHRLIDSIPLVVDRVWRFVLADQSQQDQS